jgi:hypothetical protein
MIDAGWEMPVAPVDILDAPKPRISREPVVM